MTDRDPAAAGASEDQDYLDGDYGVEGNSTEPPPPMPEKQSVGELNFDLPDDEEHIQFDEQGEIKAISFAKLIAKLTPSQNYGGWRKK